MVLTMKFATKSLFILNSGDGYPDRHFRVLSCITYIIWFSFEGLLEMSLNTANRGIPAQTIEAGLSSKADM